MLYPPEYNIVLFYKKRNGFIEQWGRKNNTGQQGYINFPIQYTNIPSVYCQIAADANQQFYGMTNVSTTAIRTLYNDANGYYYWRAVGY